MEVLLYMHFQKIFRYCRHTDLNPAVDTAPLNKLRTKNMHDNIHWRTTLPLLLSRGFVRTVLGSNFGLGAGYLTAIFRGFTPWMKMAGCYSE
jgi:hypothetical protein